jgi:hypothetical protein
MKAGQLNFQDEDFADYWRDCKAAGIPRSSYWFCDAGMDGVSQARKYWSVVGSDPGEGMLFADYEFRSWTDWHKLYDFIMELKRLSGFPSERIGIYTGYYYFTDHSPKDPIARQWFKQFPLWLASYSLKPDYVKVPAPWDTALIWQDGTPVIGIEVGAESKEIDHNKFNGDETRCMHYMGRVGDTVQPPPEGDKVILYYADLKSGYTSNVRQGPGLSSPVITPSMVGPLTIAMVSEKTTKDGYDWYQISSPREGWIALTSSYTNFRPAAPVADDYPIKVTVEMKSGKIYVASNIVQVTST